MLAARQEGFGLVVAESMACGTPVVAAREGAPPELLGDDGVGALFEPDDPEALARALAEALDLAADSGTRAACRARGELFSVERTVQRYHELYAELAGA